MNIYLHILTFAVLSLIPLVAIAQPVIERVILFPDRSRGTIGRGFDDIFITDDGNYALSGANAADQNFSQWLILSDTEGNMIFQRFVDGNDINQSFNSIIEADNGDLVTAGYEFGHNGGDASVLRTSSEGEILWHRYYGQANNDQFHAVVELKSNELFFAGQSGTLAYVVKTESNGDVIWERRYGRGPASQFWAIRETRDNDILLAGTLNWAAWVLKIDGNGNEIWSNTYGQNGERLQEYFRTLLTVSNDGEYLAAGASRRTDDRTSRAFAVRLASNGREIWQRAYDLGEPGWLNQFNGAAKISSLEYILVGRHGSNLPGGFICKIDNDGDMLWRQLYRPNARPIEVVELRSVLSDREGRILTVGQGSREGAHGGIFLEYMPERSGPRIINFFPAEFELGVLTGEGLEFWVHAIDLQNDSIYYHWQRDMEEIESQDSVAQVNFLEIGDNIVSVVVTDSTGSDSARWLIHVRDLLIFSHTPDTLSLTIQRNSEIDFALDSVAYIGDLENLRYEWMIYDSAAVRWEEVAGDDRIGIRSYAFDRTGGYALKAKVFDPNVDPVPADSVQWAIQVRGVIRAYEPNLPEISLEPRQEATFELIPFNANNDSIEFWWTLNEAEDTLSTSSILSISFQDTGRYIVSGYAREQVGEEEWEEDAQRWAVSVGMLSVDDFGLDSGFRRNDDPLMISIVPNPFNDQATVTIELGGRAFLPALRADKNVRPPSAQVGGLMPVRLSLYAIDGREILRLHDGPLSPGSHTFALSHFGTFSLPSGIYLLRLQAGSHSRTVKAVLLR